MLRRTARRARPARPGDTLARVARIPTAPVAAGSLVAGYAVAVASGSRPLGGLVLLLGGMVCMRMWTLRHGPRMAISLACVALFAFILSHLLALAVGAWPAVLIVAAGTAAVVWIRADARVREAGSTSAGAAAEPRGSGRQAAT
jgi:hypothetical protein